MVESDSQTENTCEVTDATTEPRQRIIPNRNETNGHANGTSKQTLQNAPPKNLVIYWFFSNRF